MFVQNYTYMNRGKHSFNNKLRYLLMMFSFIIMVPSYAQTATVSATECNCLNNATVQGNGQFEEVITINDTPGKIWSIKAVVGLFNLMSPAPPAAPIQLVPGLTITEVNAGVYRLRAKRIDNTSWSIVFTDGTINLPIFSQRMCKYPRREFVGDKGVCINRSKKYRLDMPSNLINTITWSRISGPASISGPTNTPEVTLNYTNVTGQVILRAVGTARSFVGQTSGLCNFDLRDTIEVINDPVAIPLACKGQLNITLLGDCTLEITPNLILEDIQRPLSHYDVVLRDVQADTFLPTPWVDGRYINKNLEVSIFHECSGNSCWGYVLLEDKAIPPLVCPENDTIDCDEVDFPELTGMPLPPTAFFTRTGPNSFDVVGYDFCSTVKLTYSDKKISSHCHGDVGGVIMRTWIAIDGAGNSTTCVQEIAIRKAELGDIDWPEDYDNVLGPNPSLEACEPWMKLPNGHPHPDFTGRPTGLLCSNLNVDFEDTRFKICEDDKTFKIRRKWTILDVCTGVTLMHSQTIAIMDNTPPVCNVVDSLVVTTTGTTCVGTINVPIPDVTDCINWNYTVAIKPVDDSGDPYTGATTEGISLVSGGRYVIQNLSENHTEYWLSYYIFDGCSNHTRCFTTVTIKDLKAPVAVCKQFTFVALNEQGLAWAGFDAFDNGSYDNCAIDKIELRRMEDSTCFRRNEWSDKVLFCCEDLGKTVMVIMRVTDKSGNYNECMVEVTVQDNTPPKFHKCPRDTSMNCGGDIHNLGRFGFPIIIDSCGYTFEEQVVKDLNECGIGKITRIFIATDKSGNKSSCQQMITVIPTTPFNSSNIIWPSDYTVNNGCRQLDIDPEDLPLSSRFPRWRNQPPCSQPSYDYTDIVFQYADSACFKIIREWTVIDWCQFDPRAPYQTSWTHKQVIRVLNFVAPTITKGCGLNDITVEDGGGACDARIRLRAEGTDDCPNPIYFSYEIDLDNNGTIDFSENGQTINKVVPFGKHKITWTARDECGNTTKCSRVFDVKDVKKPTPVCFTQIVSVVMPSSKMITLWAKDFIKEATDNCSPTNKIKFSFTEDRKDSSKVFTCEDLVEYGTEGIPVRIYAFDTTGNFDYCEATLVLQDNSGACAGVTASARLSITGTVMDFDYKPMADASVKINADALGYPKTISTTALGTYEFKDLRNGLEYSWNTEMSDDAIKGVNTLDIINIQRHILGLQRITDPMKMIAADVNFDQRVTITDLIYLRQLILGIVDNFESKQSWRFVTANDMPTVAELYPINETYLSENLTKNLQKMDFMGIKIGDVDGSYANSSLNGRTARYVTIENSDNNEILSNKVLLGTDGTLITNGLQMEMILPKGTNITHVKLAENISEFDLDYFYNVELNQLRIILTSKDGRSYLANEKLIEIGTAQRINIFDVHLSNTFQSAVYRIDDEILESAALEIRHSAKDDLGLKVYQNTPNPFTNDTELVFEIGKDEEVTIKVFNTEGKEIFSRHGNYTKGMNKVKISGQELDAEGILIYQILTKTHYSGRKMIKLK
jgi:hypothetical protein